MIEKYVDQEELKRLLTHMVAILTVLMIGTFFATVVIPGLRNTNKPESQTPVSPVVGEPGWLNPAEYPPERGKEIPPVDPQTLINVSPELLARGKELFSANCVQCHGESGHGDGPGAQTLNPPPRNFTIPDGWVNGYDMPSIYKTLTEGIEGSSMSAFDFLSRKDRMALVHYVRSFGTFPSKTGSPEAMAGLIKELTRAGEVTPNKIPVSMAMEKIASEYHDPAPFIIDTEDSSEEEQLLRHMIVDENRAARTLSDSDLWRSGLKECAASLAAGAPENGFSSEVATLNTSEWKTLYAAILKELGGNAKR